MTKAQESTSGYVPRLKQHYIEAVRPAMLDQFKYSNPMRVPEIEKVVLNMGIGEATADRKKVEQATRDMTLIAGQKPVMTKARKSIANFKLRDNMAIGCKVTLRKARMYEFLDRLVTIALPRVKDFRGLNPKSFDGRGNYAMGIKEHIIFPEIDYDKVEQILGHGHHRVHDSRDRRRGPRASETIQLPLPAIRRGGGETMAKTGMIERNNKRRRITARDAQKRADLKEIANNKDIPMEERFAARLKLAQLPRNGSPTRVRNRCEVTGRPRAFYRKLRMSRIALRDLGNKGLIPGLVKSSW